MSKVMSDIIDLIDNSTSNSELDNSPADESGNEAELADQSEQSFEMTGEQSTSFSQSSTSSSQSNDTIRM